MWSQKQEEGPLEGQSWDSSDTNWRLLLSPYVGPHSQLPQKEGKQHRKPEGGIREAGQVEFVPQNLRESVETFNGISCHRNHMVGRNGEDTAMWEYSVYWWGEGARVPSLWQSTYGQGAPTLNSTYITSWRTRMGFSRAKYRHIRRCCREAKTRLQLYLILDIDTWVFDLRLYGSGGDSDFRKLIQSLNFLWNLSVCIDLRVVSQLPLNRKSH